MKQRRAVALLIETSNAYARGLLEGIIEYQRERDSWSVYLPEHERGAAPPSWLSGWPGDGIIARIETAAIANAVTNLSIPVIDVSSARRVENIPWVETDDAAIAALAFDHLYERGFRSFAFCGPKGLNWSRWRREQFVLRCRQSGMDCDCYETESPYRQSRERTSKRESGTQTLEQWLVRLPRPTGIMCAYDFQAQVVLDTCRNLDIAVPEQIAVIGVDNDPLLCDLSRPSLTSVAPDARGAGYYAAQLLDDEMSKPARLKRSQTSDAPAKLLQPLGIVQRQSTDVMAVSDPLVSKAMQFIRDHACDGIQVADLLAKLDVSRRSMEAQFLKATGKTPHEMITMARLNRVKQLLQQSDLSLESIASLAGYEHPEYMSVAFRKRFGMSPGKYRKQMVR